MSPADGFKCLAEIRQCISFTPAVSGRAGCLQTSRAAAIARTVPRGRADKGPHVPIHVAVSEEGPPWLDGSKSVPNQAWSRATAGVSNRAARPPLGGYRL